MPTSAAARRLRGALAARAEETGTAVWSPQVITPEGLLSRAGSDSGVASRAACVLAWAAVLEAVDLRRFPALFPVPPDSQDRRWALNTARTLVSLKRTLEEGGRSISDAARDLGRSHPEAARWAALATLETMAAGRLRSAGLEDPAAARIAAAHSPVLPEGTARVCVIGVPDSVALVRTALQAHAARGVPVEIVVHAPESLADAFDAWGRPVPEVWTSRPIDIPDFRETVVALPRPADEADFLLREWRKSGPDEHAIAMATADPAVGPALISAAAAGGLSVHDPQGTPVVQHELLRALKEVAVLLQTGRIDAAGRLLRIPEVLELAGREACAGISRTAILRQWDEFCERHLPQFLPGALETARREAAATCVPAVLQWLRELVEFTAGAGAGAAAWDLPERLYRERTFATGESFEAFAAALDLWQSTMEDVRAGSEAFFPDLPVAMQMELAFALLREARIYPEAGRGPMALYGWLELPWLDAPRLAIAGLNDGLVPEAFTSDPWLPDGARAALDLPTSVTRLARDAYLLTSLLESRGKEGGVRLIAARESETGDPLKPSRLLFQCPADELPGRVRHLFAGEAEDSAGTPPAWHRAWRLVPRPPPRDAPAFSRLSVTAFRDYLKCPFRFYLKHVLGMEETDPARGELDPRDFGNLIHDAIELLHRDESLRDSADADEIRAFLLDAVGRLATARYGAPLSIPVFIQLESAKNRLAAFASLHASAREQGWRCESAEIRFPELPGSEVPVRIGGLEIRGRIDLIERHQETGALRIIDYKTGSDPKTPEKAHLAAIRGESPDIPQWQRIGIGGKPFRWIDLQLPLYAGIAAAHFGSEVSAGYFNLPRAVSQTALCMWENLTPEIIAAAQECARTIAEKIQACEFWPPVENPRPDDFKSLIFGSAAGSFDPRELLTQAELVRNSGG